MSPLQGVLPLQRPNDKIIISAVDRNNNVSDWCNKGEAERTIIFWSVLRLYLAVML